MSLYKGIFTTFFIENVSLVIQYNRFLRFLSPSSMDAMFPNIYSLFDIVGVLYVCDNTGESEFQYPNKPLHKCLVCFVCVIIGVDLNFNIQTNP